MLTEIKWASTDMDLDDVACIKLQALKSSLQIASNSSKQN